MNLVYNLNGWTPHKQTTKATSEKIFHGQTLVFPCTIDDALSVDSTVKRRMRTTAKCDALDANEFTNQ